jgi:hypothetical protein
VLRGISGPLLTADYLLATAAHSRIAPSQLRSFSQLRAGVASRLGLASHPWQVLSVSARPLMEWLGWPVTAIRVGARDDDLIVVPLIAAGVDEVALVVVGPGRIAAHSRRAAAAALTSGTRWAIATDGVAVRLIDALRSEGRGHLDFDLDACGDDPAGIGWMAWLLGPSAYESGGASRVAHAITASDALGHRVCLSLRNGVGRALDDFTRAVADARRRRHGAADCRRDALTAVYRSLFLLFAEARQLVPLWHPVYHRAYSLEALRTRLARGQSARGTWAALQAIARLAHSGAQAGDLHVTAFNGRLFSPSRAPLLDHLALDDSRVAAALESMCFTRTPGGERRRIAYGDLGVEELGSVYEHLLDDPSGGRLASSRHAASVTGSARKTTGTFYTPRAIADALVAETLEPLVAGRTADAILELRVLDPAMGSGAFLVAAGRFLLSAWERALVEQGAVSESDVSETDRVATSRRIASQCLFGVDRNPMAVQLAQLSLWLATLASNRPLSFLDHHLVTGNSLIGASPVDVLDRAPGRAPDALPLESLFDWADPLTSVRRARRQIEGADDDAVAAVHAKEAALEALASDVDLAAWKRACDLWCAAWMPGAPPRQLYHAMLDLCLGRASHSRDVERRRDRTLAVAADVGCFHWPLEFPEVFLDAEGRPSPSGGFDAVIGNPPWEMLRGDRGRETSARPEGAALVAFARNAGVYRSQGRGHANQCQLFVERALQLARPGGRVGLVLPASLLSDEGSARLRRSLMLSHRLESITVFDNRRALFPIHRSYRFATLTAARSEPPSATTYRSGIVDAAERASAPAIRLTPSLLERLSGPGLAIPDLPTPDDLRIVEQLATDHPWLSAPDGWHAHFGRELNATDDRECLTAGGDGLPVIEGRHLSPFRVDVSAASRTATRSDVEARLGSRSRVDHARLAYRDVASATNRTTLIAAIVPRGVVTVHTVFCLRTPRPLDEQQVLCALLNSYVANYLVRRWVTTHVTTSLVARLPVPVVRRGDGLFERLQAASAVLSAGEDAGAAVAVQVASAEAYRVTPAVLGHILATFPLVPAGERAAIAATSVSGMRP